MGSHAYAWTSEIEDEIFSRIAKGEAIRNICNDDWLPTLPTFYKRLRSDDSFIQRYAHAREVQADMIFEEILGIADEATGETVQQARLRIDARKWIAGKLRPKVYGDKVTVAGDPESPVQVEHGVAPAAQILLERINAIAERSGKTGEPDA